MTSSISEAQSARTLRAWLLALCVVIYVVGMGVLIAQASEAAIRPLVEVRYGIFAFGGVVVSCVVAMVLFARRVPVASEGEKR